jgi:hypothetical protein
MFNMAGMQLPSYLGTSNESSTNDNDSSKEIEADGQKD